MATLSQVWTYDTKRFSFHSNLYADKSCSVSHLSAIGPSSIHPLHLLCVHVCNLHTWLFLLSSRLFRKSPFIQMCQFSRDIRASLLGTYESWNDVCAICLKCVLADACTLSQWALDLRKYVESYILDRSDRQFMDDSWSLWQIKRIGSNTTNHTDNFLTD